MQPIVFEATRDADQPNPPPGERAVHYNVTGSFPARVSSGDGPGVITHLLAPAPLLNGEKATVRQAQDASGVPVGLYSNSQFNLRLTGESPPRHPGGRRAYERPGPGF